MEKKEFACQCLDCEDKESPCTELCDDCIGCIEAKEAADWEMADGMAAYGNYWEN